MTRVRRQADPLEVACHVSVKLAPDPEEWMCRCPALRPSRNHPVLG
jgi:hypothetical protein